MSTYKDYLCEMKKCPRCDGETQQIEDGKWYVSACIDEDGCGWLQGDRNDYARDDDPENNAYDLHGDR